MLLLDEPFGALDAKVRKELRRWLRRLHDELHITSIFVTHDQEEALEVADRVVVINKGKIEQIGTPQDVYDHPVSPFVYQFLGNVNEFNSHVHEGEAKIGNIGLKIDAHQSTQNSPAVAYVDVYKRQVSNQALSSPKWLNLCFLASDQTRRRASCTFFSTTPFSQPEATLKKSGSNR